MAKGKQVVDPAAAYIITDILAGNTDKKVNPFWGEWAIYDGKTRRPAAYKTGTTSDNKDVAAYGYLAPPADKEAPALAVGVWMGNSDNTPNDGKLSLDTSAPLWSAILTEVSQDADRRVQAAQGLETAEVDAFTGLKPGPFTKKTVTELFVPGTVPTQKETIRIALAIDEATGLLWQDGCAGPKVTKGFFNLVRGRGQLPGLAEGQRGLGRPRSRGSGVRGGPKGPARRTSTTAVRAVRSVVGRARSPRRRLCPLYVPPTFCDPFGFGFPTPTPDVPTPTCIPRPTDTAAGAAAGVAAAAAMGTGRLGRRPTFRTRRLELDDRRPVAALAALARAEAA